MPYIVESFDISKSFFLELNKATAETSKEQLSFKLKLYSQTSTYEMGYIQIPTKAMALAEVSFGTFPIEGQAQQWKPNGWEDLTADHKVEVEVLGQAWLGIASDLNESGDPTFRSNLKGIFWWGREQEAHSAQLLYADAHGNLQFSEIHTATLNNDSQIQRPANLAKVDFTLDCFFKDDRCTTSTRGSLKIYPSFHRVRVTITKRGCDELIGPTLSVDGFLVLDSTVAGGGHSIYLDDDFQENI